MGKNIKIEILDSVHCQADKEARKIILPCLTVKTNTWEKGLYGGKPGIKKKSLITGRQNSSGLFFTGLLPRVKSFCKRKKTSLTIKGEEEKIKADTKSPSLKGITFREDQKKAIRKIIRKGRGQIVAPTGSGKTIIALGLFLCFSSRARLFLCHTNDIYYQTIEKLEEHNFKNVFAVNSKSDWKKIRSAKNPIMVAKVQSFARINVDNYIDFIDVVIVDEVHHVNKSNSQYGKILQSMLAPVRIGLTATPDPKEEKRLIAEGLFGPIAYKLKISEGVEKGIVARPMVNLESVPYNLRINKKGEYKFVNLYKYGIIKNSYRNKKIVELSKNEISSKGIVLIIIEKIEHGKIIQKYFKKEKIDVPFVHGKTNKDKRNEIRKALSEGKLNIAICSRVWKEGVNIPSLTHIINAAGYKDEKGVIQSIGRGLRVTKEKKEVKLTDFLDPYRFLAEHSITRIQIYKREKWI